MTRYVIDAPTLLHLVANDVQVSPTHQLLAPNLIRSQSLSLLLEAARRGNSRRSPRTGTDRTPPERWYSDYPYGPAGRNPSRRLSRGLASA